MATQHSDASAILEANGMATSSRNIYYLRDAPVMHAILALGLPMAAGLAITSLYNVVNSYFVGHHGSVADLAALIMGYPVIGTITAIAGLFGVGGSTLLARMLGSGDTSRAKALSSFVCYASLGAGVLLAVLGCLALDPLLHMLGASADGAHAGAHHSGAEVYAATSGFVLALLLGAPLWLLMFTLEQLVRGEGYAKQSMYGLIWGVLANLAADYVLIVLLHMGATGSAWAIACANLAAIVYYLIFLGKHSPYFSMRLTDFSCAPQIVRPVLSVGASQLAQSMFIVFSTLLLNHLSIKYGQAATASFGVSIRLIMVPQTLCMGIAMGAIPLFAYSWGAGNRERLRASLRCAVIFICAAACGFMVPALVLSDWALYLAGGSALEGTADIVFTALVCSTVGYGLVVLWISYFQACAKSLAALGATAALGVCFVLCVLAGDALFGFEGLALSFPVALSSAAAIGTLLFVLSGGTRIPPSSSTQSSEIIDA